MEWNESEGAVKRTYQGFRKRSLGVVQFDTTKNRFLAAGDEFVIKFWDMDNANLLTTVDANGGLPVCYIMEFLMHIFRAATHINYMHACKHLKQRMTHTPMNINLSLIIRQVHGYASTKRVHCWPFLQTKMALKSWRMLMDYVCCAHLKIVLSTVLEQSQSMLQR